MVAAVAGLGVGFGTEGTADTVTDDGAELTATGPLPVRIDCVSTMTKPEFDDGFSFDRGTTVTVVAGEMEILFEIGALISSGGGRVTLVTFMAGLFVFTVTAVGT